MKMDADFCGEGASWNANGTNSTEETHPPACYCAEEAVFRLVAGLLAGLVAGLCVTLE